MKRIFRFDHLLFLLLLIVSANAFLWVASDPGALLFVVPSVLAVHILTGTFSKRIPLSRLRVCYHGAVLLVIFLAAALFSIVYHIVLAGRLFPDHAWTWVWSALFCAAILAALLLESAWRSASTNLRAVSASNSSASVFVCLGLFAA